MSGLRDPGTLPPCRFTFDKRDDANELCPGQERDFGAAHFPGGANFATGCGEKGNLTRLA